MKMGGSEMAHVTLESSCLLIKDMNMDHTVHAGT